MACVAAAAPAPAARPSSRTSSTRCRSAAAAASVVTLHDLHFERDPTVMGLVDRLTFKTVVPRSARKADHVLAVSERTKRDAVELYGLAAGQDHGHAARRRPGVHAGRRHARRLPALRRRGAGAQGPARRARRRATRSALPLVVVGPEKEPELARELRARGADVRGWCRQARARRALPRARPRSCSRRATRASGSRCSRRWRAARPSCSRTTRRCARSRATQASTATSRRRPQALADRERYAQAGLERAAQLLVAGDARALTVGRLPAGSLA